MNVLTVKEVAARLRVSQGCIYSLCGSGALRHLRLGTGRGAIRIREEDLQSFVERCVREEKEEVATPRRMATPKAFTNLNASRLLDAWRKQGVKV